MIELPEKFPFVDIKLFASYWKWYAEIAIKCGLPQEKIIDIIQEVCESIREKQIKCKIKGKQRNAQPLRALNDFFDDYMGRIVENPDLGQGQRAADPDMSVFNVMGEFDIL